MVNKANKLNQEKAQRQLQIDLLMEIHELAQDAVMDESLRVRFKLRCSRLEAIYGAFEKIHATIVSLVTSSENPDLAAEKAIRHSFMDNFYTVKTVYANLFSDKVDLNNTANRRSGEQDNTGGNRYSNIKLKPLHIPTFDGNYKEWPTFRDLFRTLIHENEDLKPIEKFQYLLTFLSREPLKIIKTLPLSDDNYTIAFETLESRYENKRMLASTYWQSIFKLKPVSSQSPRELRSLLDNFRENLDALNTLDFPVDLKDFILFSILHQKLDPATQERFELETASTNIPSLACLEGFLKKQCHALENVAMAGNKYSTSTYAKPPEKVKSISSLVATSKGSVVHKCTFCRENHWSNQCPSLSDKSPSERFRLVKDKNLCINCFGNHKMKDCQSKSSCRTCKARHNSLLHFPRTSSPSTVEIEAENNVHLPVCDNSSPATVEMQSLANVSTSRGMIMLSTARVDILDAWGNYQSVRALVDTGSQVNIVTSRCLQRLGLNAKSISTSILGIGQSPSSITKAATCTICRVGQPEISFVIETVVLPSICSKVPGVPLLIDDWSYISNLELADPQFNVPGHIDLLIGAELFPLILREGRITGNGPTAVNTAFGWIVMGKVSSPSIQSNFTSLFVSSDSALDCTLRRFWEVEEVPKRICSSPEDIKCEEHYSRNYFREPEGRYCVALPFKGSEPDLGDSRSGALRQLYSLENRLKRDTSTKVKYEELMGEYLDKGYMELAPMPPSNPLNLYYIPHHCIFNPSSSTTPIRIVFNASYKTVDGTSLNDSLFVGPKLQNDITVLLLRFRLHSIVFTADIKQMYLQIKILPEHADYQRILWRLSPQGPVQEFRLSTVVFGVSSSPFLAIRTLFQLAEDEKDAFPLASKVIRSSTFVDDVVTGCSSLEEALKLKAELIGLLAKGKFELRKWSSNSSVFLETIPESHRRHSSLCLDEKMDSTVKVLGLKWISQSDVFTYSVECLSRSASKRTILSELARIFDPLGFLSPLTFFAKFLIQQLWILGLDWDQEPPGEILKVWNQYRFELSCLSNLSIPRCIIPEQWSVCELHAFADSSEKGYAGVIYFRFETSSNIKISLICAKSKVAPLKRVSLPRLELCAAVLVAKLVAFVVETYSGRILISRIFAWSDSSVTLSWIKSSPHRWKTFVSNRVSVIQDLVSPDLWHHVRSSDNPADCASRGLLPQELLKTSIWWQGPEWLKLPKEEWPSGDFEGTHGSFDISEERKNLVLISSFVSLDSLDILLEKYSSLAKIKRIIAYVLRFAQRDRSRLLKGAFVEEELNGALLVLVKRVQHIAFSEILDNVEKGRPVLKEFRKLNPFIASDGLLRVGGRLSHSGLLYDQKHPAILPRNHRLTYLIIEEVHRKHMHPGMQTLHFLILQNFWILAPRRAIRHVLSKCMRCYRVRPQPFQPPMGDLPSIRVNQVKPFQIVGVDFGGPFNVTLNRVRGAKVHKAYLCLFVCCTTKALHLELASDLSTECFLAALRRFVSRRGRCNTIVSDQGTNFVGAKHELNKLMQQVAESESIAWKLHPPSGPHFSGLAEAGVKSVKAHLLRVIGEQTLTYEEFYTVLVQIEAMLNSRPLCPLSSDPHDLSVLTPGHFLILEPLTSIPDPDLTHLSLNRLSRWQLLQRLQQDFWRRWHREYLHTLQQRNKWLEKVDVKVSVGTLVLVKDEQTSPLRWRLARIIKLHPGSDGVPRVATIHTTHGRVQRPLVKLCPLPISES